jgi:hypothetical protein
MRSGHCVNSDCSVTQGHFSDIRVEADTMNLSVPEIAVWMRLSLMSYEYRTSRVMICTDGVVLARDRSSNLVDDSLE